MWYNVAIRNLYSPSIIIQSLMAYPDLEAIWPYVCFGIDYLISVWIFAVPHGPKVIASTLQIRLKICNILISNLNATNLVKSKPADPSVAFEGIMAIGCMSSKKTSGNSESDLFFSYIFFNHFNKFPHISSQWSIASFKLKKYSAGIFAPEYPRQFQMISANDYKYLSKILTCSFGLSLKQFFDLNSEPLGP